MHLINDLDETGRPRVRMTLAGDVSTWSGNQPRTKIIPVDGVELLVRRPDATEAYLPLENRQLPVEKTDQGLRVKVGHVRAAQHDRDTVAGRETKDETPMGSTEYRNAGLFMIALTCAGMLTVASAGGSAAAAEATAAGNDQARASAADLVRRLGGDDYKARRSGPEGAGQDGRRRP